jgi:hypothetical protein
MNGTASRRPRGVSSAGRAPALQAGGHRFDPGTLHQESAANGHETFRIGNVAKPLAYTRTQAAAALGVSRTTFDRRVLPLLATIDVPWGPRLVPVDELKQVAREWRQPARGRGLIAPVGRPRVVSDELVLRIQAEHADGRACARSPATSTRTERGPPTAARSGGPRPCARFSSAHVRPRPSRPPVPGAR